MHLRRRRPRGCRGAARMRRDAASRRLSRALNVPSPRAGSPRIGIVAFGLPSPRGGVDVPRRAETRAAPTAATAGDEHRAASGARSAFPLRRRRRRCSFGAERRGGSRRRAFLAVCVQTCAVATSLCGKLPAKAAQRR